jgi:hypothetical protein
MRTAEVLINFKPVYSTLMISILCWGVNVDVIDFVRLRHLVVPASHVRADKIEYALQGWDQNSCNVVDSVEVQVSDRLVRN